MMQEKIINKNVRRCM